MLLSEGQMSDYKGAALMLPAMPKAKQLLADKGYDADWFRAALAKRRITPCIPSEPSDYGLVPVNGDDGPSTMLVGAPLPVLSLWATGSFARP
jgi:transposase